MRNARIRMGWVREGIGYPLPASSIGWIQAVSGLNPCFKVMFTLKRLWDRTHRRFFQLGREFIGCRNKTQSA